LHDGFSLDAAFNPIGRPDGRPLVIDPAFKLGLVFCSQQHGCLRRRGNSTPLRLYQFPSDQPAISGDRERTPNVRSPGVRVRDIWSRTA
jgi:hypothetical protein